MGYRVVRADNSVGRMTPISGPSDSLEPPASAAPRVTFKELAGDAIRYWEPRRFVYNIVLALVVCAEFIITWPAGRPLITVPYAILLFILAVIANLLYCTVYAVDLFAQFSNARGMWRKWRWVVLIIGTVLAAAIAHLFFTAWTDPNSQ